MYKLIAIDIDGTMISMEKPYITDRVKKAIYKAKEMGVHVILISGRNYNSMTRFLDELEIKDYGITINGCVVMNIATGEKIFETYLDQEVAKGLTEIFIRERVPYTVFADLYTYAPKEFESNSTIQYLMLEKDNVRLYEDTEQFLANIRTNKYMIMADEKKSKSIVEEVKKKYPGVYVECGAKGHIEIYPIGTNKGLALTKLASQLKINMRNVMAIGDGENDISMLKVAGLGIAMGNAVTNVKSHANYVTKTVDEDGVAYAIEKFILNNVEENVG
ncbi:MAG: Cof-type HAD-IIB family hydrolase [Eubacteriales bacterium]